MEDPPPTSDDADSSGDNFRDNMMQRTNQYMSTLLQFAENDPNLSKIKNQHHPRVLDHYSLLTPSSTVRFRSSNVHVYDSQGSQLIMEERLTQKNAAVGKMTSLADSTNEEGQSKRKTSTNVNVTIKRVVYSSPELMLLRGLYSVIAFFMAATLGVFSVGLLLFIISDLAEKACNILWYGETKGKF